MIAAHATHGTGATCSPTPTIPKSQVSELFAVSVRERPAVSDQAGGIVGGIATNRTRHETAKFQH